MAVGDKQRLIISIMQIVLGEKAQEGKSFSWLKNKHLKEDFHNLYESIDNIFIKLNGDRNGLDNKSKKKLSTDCYFGGKYNFIFEFDEIQHFTFFKKIALRNYPSNLEIGFDIQQYIEYCNRFHTQALKKGPPGYRKPKPEFPFENGRGAQRAYLDCFRDLLPKIHGLKPTTRISEFEVSGIVGIDNNSIRTVERIIEKKLSCIY